jgi:hypothetical protein
MAEEFDVNKVPDPWAEKKGFLGFGDTKPESFNINNVPDPWAPPKEPALLGIPRGLVTGLTKKGPGVVGGAMQFVSTEGSAVNEAGKSISDYAASDTVPEEQKGFWEKGAELVGTILPLIVAGAVAPEGLAAAGVAGGGAALFGLSQAHETEKMMKEKGLEPGAAPYLTGAVTAVTMAVLPAMTGEIFNGTIAGLVGKGIAEQSVGQVMAPSAGKILADFGVKAAETQVLFAGQSLSVAGIEKAYGLPHDMAQELWESAKTGAALSLFSAAGMPVRRMADNAHLRTLANGLSEKDVAGMSPEQIIDALQNHADNRLGYAKAIRGALEKAGKQDVAKSWYEYAKDKISNNQPIETETPLDSLSLKIAAMEDSAEKNAGVSKEQMGTAPKPVTIDEGAQAEADNLEKVAQTPANDDRIMPEGSVVYRGEGDENVGGHWWGDKASADSFAMMRENGRIEENDISGKKLANAEKYLNDPDDLGNSQFPSRLDSQGVKELVDKALADGYDGLYSDKTKSIFLPNKEQSAARQEVKGSDVTQPAAKTEPEKPSLTEEQKKAADLEDRRQKASEDLVAIDRNKPQKPKKGASVKEEAAYQNKLKDWKKEREPLQKSMDEIDNEVVAAKETPEQKIAKDVNDALSALGKETDLNKIEKVIAAHPEENAAQITKRIVQSLPTKAKTINTRETGAENLERAVIRLGGINPEGKYSTKMLRKNATKGVVNATKGLRPDVMTAQLKAEGWNFKDVDHLMELLESKEARDVKSPAKGDELLNKTAEKQTKEWADEQAKLAEEGADPAAVAAHIETATETFRRELIEKGHSPEEVDQVLEDIKMMALGKKQTPKLTPAEVEKAQVRIPGASEKETTDILSNQEMPHDKPLSEQAIQKNQEMFGTAKGLKETADKIPDMKPDEIMNAAEELNNREAERETKGAEIEGLCNSKGKGAFQE